MKKVFRRRAGYSLIEVIAAIFIVAVGASLLVATVPISRKSAKMVGNHQQAASLIQHKVDQLRAVGWGRLTFAELRAAGIIDAAPVTPPFRFDTADGLSAIYRSPVGTINITDFSADIKQVTISLTWSGTAYRQGNGSLSVVALIAKG